MSDWDNDNYAAGVDFADQPAAMSTTTCDCDCHGGTLVASCIHCAEVAAMTTPTANTTPRPWLLDTLEGGGWAVVIESNPDGATVVAELDDTTGNRAANAALIVLAVNNHDALLAALRMVVFATNGTHDTMLSHDHSLCLPFALEQASAAIAAAEGGS